MKFKYFTTSGVVDCRGKMVKRPMLELELLDFKGNKVFDSLALVDSGADTTMVNAQYAVALGVDLSKAKDREVMGIGDGKVPVKVGTFSFRIKRIGDEVKVPAWFVDSPNVNILLGQEVFFENYRIKFEKDHDTFEVTKFIR